MIRASLNLVVIRAAQYIPSLRFLNKKISNVLGWFRTFIGDFLNDFVFGKLSRLVESIAVLSD